MSTWRKVALLGVGLLGIAIVIAIAAAHGPVPADGLLPPQARALARRFDVFERPQTGADRSDPYLARVKFPGFMRLVATLPNGRRVFLFIARPLVSTDGSPPNYSIWESETGPLVDAGAITNEPQCCTFPSMSETVSGYAMQQALVHNGVKRVRWIWNRRGRRPRFTLTIATPDSIAVGVAPARYSDFPTEAIAYGARRQVLDTEFGPAYG